MFKHRLQGIYPQYFFFPRCKNFDTTPTRRGKSRVFTRGDIFSQFNHSSPFSVQPPYFNFLRASGSPVSGYRHWTSPLTLSSGDVGCTGGEVNFSRLPPATRVDTRRRYAYTRNRLVLSTISSALDSDNRYRDIGDRDPTTVLKRCGGWISRSGKILPPRLKISWIFFKVEDLIYNFVIVIFNNEFQSSFNTVKSRNELKIVGSIRTIKFSLILGEKKGKGTFDKNCVLHDTKLRFYAESRVEVVVTAIKFKETGAHACLTW